MDRLIIKVRRKRISTIFNHKQPQLIVRQGFLILLVLK